MSTWTLPLSHTTPPLTSNQRLHWSERARKTRTLREEACWRARSARIGPQNHIFVQYVYQPATQRRRDRGNLVPTHKALLDGIIDAGVVPDDTPEHVTEMMPDIRPPGPTQSCWLIITTEAP